MELNECKKCGTVGWTLDELKSGECPHCSALENDDTSESGLHKHSVIKSVCPKCGCNKLQNDGTWLNCLNVECDWQTVL